MSDARWYIFVVSKTRRDNLLTDIASKRYYIYPASEPWNKEQIIGQKQADNWLKFSMKKFTANRHKQNQKISNSLCQFCLIKSQMKFEFQGIKQTIFY